MSCMNDFKSGSEFWYWFVFTEYVSLFTAVLLLYVGFQWYRHKGWRRAFFTKPSRSLALAGVLVIGGVTGFAMLRPKTGGTHQATVLPGSEERRVGKGCVRHCRSRWSPVH